MNSAVGPVAALVFALLVTGYVVQTRLPPPKPTIIGIDLGTTFSCVASYESLTGNVTIYEDEDGKKIIPSVVAILEDDVLVGYKAVEQIERNSRNTIYDAKRFIGKKCESSSMDELTKNYPFRLECDVNNNPTFKVSFRNGHKSLAPEEVGALILKRLKIMAERKIERQVSMAVIGVPADFSEEQRNATIAAGNLAGLKIMRVINEPTAAALAYGLHKKNGTNNVIVIDFGGGTLDVSLLLIEGGMFVTIAMAGNNRLGGQDVNNNLINFFRRMIENKFGVSITMANDLQIIRDKVEELKIYLTSHESGVFLVKLTTLSAFTGLPVELNYVLSRDEFNALNEELFRKVLAPVKRVLLDAQMDKSEVDEIVLVGGSTRIPRVRQLIGDFFSKTPNTSIDPDIAVAVGVAVQANVVGNGWPLQVSAIEIQNSKLRKVNLNGEDDS